MSEGFAVRGATPADISAIVHHRVSMFLDIGSADATVTDALSAATRTYLEEAMPRGEYLAWLAHPAREPGRIVAGAGVQLRRVLPFPKKHPDGHRTWHVGRQAIVLNVYTEPDFRRRGIARQVMEAVMAWARAERLDSLVLHAATDGRALYESLGFAPTNEMRYSRELTAP